MKVIKATTTNNPDVVTLNSTVEDILSQIRASEQTSIKFSEWKRVVVEHKGRKTKRMQIETLERSLAELVII